uniref:Uncharacterized protein n=1 Tax=Timema genevievae TaxID=629358 RepID=A0A7R9JU98_TIMGE|nr:unnamed protein product [Timema genevievae]
MTTVVTPSVKLSSYYDQHFKYLLEWLTLKASHRWVHTIEFCRDCSLKSDFMRWICQVDADFPLSSDLALVDSNLIARVALALSCFACRCWITVLDDVRFNLCGLLNELVIVS